MELAVIEKKVKEIIFNHFGFFLKEVKETDELKIRLVDDLGADSLDLVEITMQLEDVFGQVDPNFEIKDDETDGVATIGDISRLVAWKLGVIEERPFFPKKKNVESAAEMASADSLS